MSEPDWDASTENRYEEHRASYHGDLCERCKNDVVVENDDYCRSCITEIEGALFAVEESGYEPDDPKSPGYHDRMAEISDAA